MKLKGTWKCWDWVTLDLDLEFAHKWWKTLHSISQMTQNTQDSCGVWRCTHCDYIDTQSHILVCDSYKYLREGKNLTSDYDLVKYFRDVISLRDKLDEIAWLHLFYLLLANWLHRHTNWGAHRNIYVFVEYVSIIIIIINYS